MVNKEWHSVYGDGNQGKRAPFSDLLSLRETRWERLKVTQISEGREGMIKPALGASRGKKAKEIMPDFFL